jgi:hypothetical protein
MKGLLAVLPLVLGSCGSSTPDDPVAAALSAPLEDPASALASCAHNPFPELAITCRVQVAAAAASRNDEKTAEKACSAIRDSTWNQECHFRVGEELARQGESFTALRQCARAGRFGRFCLTHAGWHLPPDDGIDSRLPVPAVLEHNRALLDQVGQALVGATDGLEGEGRDIFRSRTWYNVYVGTGVANPAPARAAPDDQAPFARGAWALEAARLLFPDDQPLPGDAVSRMEDVYRGEAPVPTGPALPVSERLGRYHSQVPAPAELSAARIPTYGGGMRLVGSTESEDVTIACLEGLFFRDSTPADAFLPFVSDTRDRVRWTAARLLRLAPPERIDMEATLRSLLYNPDEDVRWNADDGLKGQTWLPPQQRGGPPR